MKLEGQSRFEDSATVAAASGMPLWFDPRVRRNSPQGDIDHRLLRLYAEPQMKHHRHRPFIFLSILAIAIAFGLAIGLYINKKGDSDSKISTERELRILAFRDVFPQALLADFERKHKIKILLEVAETPEDLWQAFQLNQFSQLNQSKQSKQSNPVAPINASDQQQNESNLNSSRLPSQRFDLVTLMSYQLPIASQQNRLYAIDKNRLSKFKNISPDFLNLPDVNQHPFHLSSPPSLGPSLGPSFGSSFGSALNQNLESQQEGFSKHAIFAIPVLWGLNGLLYDRARLSEPPSGWKVIFQNDQSMSQSSSKSSVRSSVRSSFGSRPSPDLKAKPPGRLSSAAQTTASVALLNSTVDLLRLLPAPTPAPARSLKDLSFTARDEEETELEQPVSTLDPSFRESLENILEVTALSEHFLSAASIFKESNPPPMVQMSHGESAFLPPSAGSWSFIYPKEKAALWVLYLAIIKSAQENSHSETAHLFLDYLLEPRAAEVLSRHTRQASANRGIQASQLDERLRPSYLRKVSLNSFDTLQGFTHAEQIRELLQQKASLRKPLRENLPREN